MALSFAQKAKKIKRTFAVCALRRSQNTLDFTDLLFQQEEVWAMNIGAVIRKRRKTHDINLSELALRSGIDAGNLSRIERGMQNHTPEKLDAIAAVLGTTASELMAESEADQPTYNKDVRESPEKEERELLRAYWSIRPDLRGAYRQIGVEMARAAHG